MVAGTSRFSDDSNGHAIVARYGTDGVRDVTFGTAGVARTANQTDRGRGLVVDGNGRPDLLIGTPQSGKRNSFVFVHVSN